ncbi:MAG: hypothetical protein R3E89_07555 [Thiolinea sp.]
MNAKAELIMRSGLSACLSTLMVIGRAAVSGNAERCGLFSRFHFQRQFAAYVGIAMRYISICGCGVPQASCFSMRTVG